MAKFNLETCICCVVLGFLIALLTVCNCGKNIPVGIEGYANCLGNSAELGTNSNQDVKNSWYNKAKDYAGDMGYQTVLQSKANYKGTPVPLQGTHFYFRDNKFAPECCPSTYSSSSGCACISPEQLDYLNKRGGNRTLPSEF